MTATMLSTVWRLRDVEDVEALCRGVLRELAGANYERRTSRTPATVRLEPADWHESLAFLLGEVVILERRFEARAGIQFRPWLYQRLRWALIDEWRRWFGRQGQRRVVDPAGGLAAGRDHGIDDDCDDESGARADLRGGRLRDSAGGDPADRSGLDRWLDPDGDRHETPAVGGAGVESGSGASGGADRTGARARGSARRAVAGASGAAPFVDCPGCGWRCYPEAPNGVDRWHFPAGCVACGEPLGAEVAA